MTAATRGRAGTSLGLTRLTLRGQLHSDRNSGHSSAPDTHRERDAHHRQSTADQCEAEEEEGSSKHATPLTRC